VAFVSAAMMGASAVAQSSETPQRFSVAISGGASKGAYEAGLNWALLKLIRESGNLHAVTGGRFRPAEIASVAGASAGGVNTILTGMTWCLRSDADEAIGNTIDKNVFRDIWLGIDINELLPAKADSRTYLPDDAVLSRKDYFAAANRLKQNWSKPLYRDGCRIPMGVTVTRVLPQALLVGDLEVQNQRFFIPFELRVGEDKAMSFFFDPADYPKLSDPAMMLLPRLRSAPEFSISDERVIDAAVTTSAFPTAFGRRRVQYCRLLVRAVSAEPEEETASDSHSDSDLVCPQGYELDEAEFADGGLFDNLPIGLARTLAEENIRARANPLPVTYMYIDPDRIRYELPKISEHTACNSANPPDACRVMDFSFFSESRLLLGALGTARRYELYRETTSDNWRLNLSQLSYELGTLLAEQDPEFDCQAELPYFQAPLECFEAVGASGRLLETTYDRIKPQISAPFSPQRLVAAGLASDCKQASGDSGQQPVTFCSISIARYRDRLAGAMMSIIKRSSIEDDKLYVSISRSRQSIHDDRALRVTSRGATITGTLLGDFGSFLDYKFREYDYYVGVYDAVVLSSQNLCELQYSRQRQQEEYAKCIDSLGREAYAAAGIESSARGRYVFARLAEREFGKQGLMAFSYSPSPPADQNMAIIHDALAEALAAGEEHPDEETGIFVTEDTFFEYLKSNGFKPTKTQGGEEPLLAEIMADPQSWPTELTRRFSARLVYLEEQAADIYAAREPDPSKRESSHTGLMGTSAHLLQSATYKYPPFTFSPSTAPNDWIWRNFIPYELGFDLVEGDMLVTWQPTWSMSKNNLLDARISLGFAGGLFRSNSDRSRNNYFALGLGYIRRTASPTLSSYGITPTWYHTWQQPEIGDQDTVGGDIHVSFLKDRLRLGFGTRDITDFNENWLLTVGITDLPGMAYWLTR